MRVAFGFKAHSGWAALVVIGQAADQFVIVERRRIELVDEVWAKQPYHAAETLPPKDAQNVVTEGIQAAHRIAIREMRNLVKREAKRENKIVACGVLTGNPMPEWTIAEILAVHFRMHKAEGLLFPEAVIEAAQECSLHTLAIPEKQLMLQAVNELGTSQTSLVNQITALGKAAGPPWGKDQKSAALAAMIALRSNSRSR